MNALETSTQDVLRGIVDGQQTLVGPGPPSLPDKDPEGTRPMSSPRCRFNHRRARLAKIFFSTANCSTETNSRTLRAWQTPP
eukprot:3643325-Lingulodinium_polyedra.AAC.1